VLAGEGDRLSPSIYGHRCIRQRRKFGCVQPGATREVISERFPESKARSSTSWP